MRASRTASAYFTKWLAGCGIRLLFNYTTLLLFLLVFNSSSAFAEQNETPLHRLLASIKTPESVDNSVFLTESIQVSGCEDYPYHDIDQHSGIKRLVSDLKAGLQQGLQCLGGQGPMGQLHPYHQHQAEKLIKLLEDDRPKSLQCVNDKLYAYAMAASPEQKLTDKALARRLKESPRLTILLDTYRIGGLLSQKFDVKIYEEFFKLNKEQIAQQLVGKPLRLEGMHRYENLPELLFHEIIHWLGHTHSSINPDLTFLYDTCCFGGSEYIKDDHINAGFQARACNILKDDELWSANHYKQIRLWRFKGYDQLKREIRDHY